MLYTNKCLEFTNNKRGDKVLELNSLYGHFISLQVDKNMNEKIKIVMNKFHKYLSLVTIAPGRYRLVNEKDDDIYLILDLLDYKNFNANSHVVVPKGTNDFEVMKNFKMTDRSGNRKWSIVILKWKPNRERNSVLGYSDTSGALKYITIDKNGKLFHSNQFKYAYFNGDKPVEMVSLLEE